MTSARSMDGPELCEPRIVVQLAPPDVSTPLPTPHAWRSEDRGTDRCRARQRDASRGDAELSLDPDLDPDLAPGIAAEVRLREAAR